MSLEVVNIREYSAGVKVVKMVKVVKAMAVAVDLRAEQLWARHRPTVCHRRFQWHHHLS